MKKFARCVLILILVIIVSGVCGYFYEDKMLTSMYTSTTQLYVVPGEENEATVRADNGGLKDDFVIIFKSGVVIQEAQRIAGTSENIAQYLTVSSPANSNIVEITCTNPDQNTAKMYVDAVAKTALKTTSIIPVKSIQILSEGTADNIAVKPDLYRNTILITAVAAVACIVLELVVVLIICAFKKPEDHSDDELEYEKYYGKYAAFNTQPPTYLGAANQQQPKQEQEEEKHVGEKKEETPSDMRDILEDFDEDYAEDEEVDDSNEELEEDLEEEHSQALADVAVSREALIPEEETESDAEMETEQQVDERIKEVPLDSIAADEAEALAEAALEEQVIAECMEAEEEIQEAETIEEETVEEEIEPEPEQKEEKMKLHSSAQVLGRIIK